MRKKDNTDYYIHRHSCFLLQYHIVFVTKFRHPVLVNGVRDAVYERIRYVADQRGFHILEINGEPDHVHILLEADTMTSPAELANVLKTQTARRARKLYGDTTLKKYYWKPYFWSDSYFISRSCGAVAPMDVVLCLAFIDSHIIINYLIHQILILCKILKKRIPFW